MDMNVCHEKISKQPQREELILVVIGEEIGRSCQDLHLCNLIDLVTVIPNPIL